MTDTPTAAEPTAQEALSTAERAYQAARDAVDAARDGIVQSRQALEAAEAEAAETMAAAIAGDGTANRAAVDKARTRVEKLRGDVEWADVQKQAAELALARTQDDAARAHRGVTREQYLAEHARWNAPDEHETTLLAQITAGVTELVDLIGTRKQLHNRLAQAIPHFPGDEKFPIPQGARAITAHSSHANLVVNHVPHPEIVDAVEAGLTKAASDAAERKQRAAHGD
jgi:hypothetical protein